MSATIHHATTEAEREAIFRLRYQIYVEEMRIFTGIADHERRMLTDAHDATGRLIYATVDDEIVGTMRLHLGGDAPFSDEFEETYGLERFRPAVDDAQMLILTRFMVRPEYRGTPLAFHLIGETGRVALEEGAQLAFCDCQTHLLRYYHRMGFRSYECPIYNDELLGTIMVPLVFVLGDLAHLERIRSPLLRAVAGHPVDREAVRRLKALLGEAAVRDVGQDGSGEGLHELYGILSDRDRDRTPLFDGLEEDEIQSLIASGYVLECAPGDQIIGQGQDQQTVYAVLSGTLEIRGGGRLWGVAETGDVVGEVNFLLASRRAADVIAGPGGAQLLYFDDRQLRKLVESPSRASSIFLLNLGKALAAKVEILAALLRTVEEIPAGDSAAV